MRAKLGVFLGVCLLSSAAALFAQQAPPFNLTPSLTSVPALSATTFNIGGTTAIGAGVQNELTKVVTGIADATATTVFTITALNASNLALINVEYSGALGAGGAVGAFEASCAGRFALTVNRVIGVAAVSAASTLADSTGSATSAGAATCTLARSLVAWSGAVGATNTQAVQITITKGSGSSTNHSAILHITLINQLASGITVS